MVLQTILRNISTKSLRPITCCRQTQKLINSGMRQTSHRLCSAAAAASTDVPLEPTFDELLASSKLMKFGRCVDKCVVGKIVDVCNDDLYVDFGGKFEIVCQRPEDGDLELYKKGKLLRIILYNFEMTGKFLGDTTSITVCEANGRLLGPLLSKKPVFEKFVYF